jgi:hypothetical protein
MYTTEQEMPTRAQQDLTASGRTPGAWIKQDRNGHLVYVRTWSR